MSGNKCSFKNCGRNKKLCPNLRKFSFPVSYENRCNQWVTNSGNEELKHFDKQKLKSKFLCELHFTEENYLRSERLRKDAVPVPYDIDSMTSFSDEECSFDEVVQPDEPTEDPLDPKENGNAAINRRAGSFKCYPPAKSKTAMVVKSEPIGEEHQSEASSIKNPSPNTSFKAVFIQSEGKSPLESPSPAPTFPHRLLAPAPPVFGCQGMSKSKFSELKHKMLQVRVRGYQKEIIQKSSEIHELKTELEDLRSCLRKRSSRRSIWLNDKTVPKYRRVFMAMQYRAKEVPWTYDERELALDFFAKYKDCYKFLCKKGFNLPSVVTLNKWVRKSKLNQMDEFAEEFEGVESNNECVDDDFKNVEEIVKTEVTKSSPESNRVQSS